jgi:ribosomal protein S18 acetylase RimI-like enzyme
MRSLDAPVLEVREVRVEETAAISALVARAFRDDPLVSWPIPLADASGATERFFASLHRAAARRGWLWTVDASSAAMWVPPGFDDAFHKMEAEATGAFDDMEGVDQGVALWSWVGDRHPDGRHWYLDHVAVDAARRGSGIGTALIRHGLDAASAEHVPAFLLTDVPNNVPYYERLGFRVVEEGRSPVGGPYIWFMRADP